MSTVTPSNYTLPSINTGLELTEDQRMIRDMVREFAEAEVAPQAHDIDENHRFPLDTWHKIVELGLPGIPFSEDLGGSNGGTLAYAIAVEELGRVCGSTGLTLAAHVSLGTYPIYAFGGDELRNTYVPKLIAGEYMGAYGLTEPNAGSDSGGTETTAVLDGDEYVLNGRKCFITNANHAGVFIVTAVTDKSLGAKGISAFVVPRDTPGFSLEKGEVKLGMRGSDWASLVFEDARIPRNHLLGPEGQGFKTFMKTLDGGRISIGALSLGIAIGAYENAPPDRGGTPPRLPRGADQGRRAALQQGGRHGQAARLGDGHEGDLRRDPGVRWLRLQPRIPGRAHVA
jgi:alkylation response protein AidB-like acyl-CoA dehydrogenase